MYNGCYKFDNKGRTPFYFLVFLVVTLSILFSGCAVQRVDNLSIPDPSGSRTLSEYILKKFPEVGANGDGWDLYKVYTDYNDGQCNGKSPKRPKIKLKPSFFIDFLAKYSKDKKLYLVHAGQQQLGKKRLIHRPYLIAPDTDIASTQHATRIVSGGVNSRKVRRALDMEINSLVTEYQRKTVETFAETFFISTTPDLHGVLDAVVLSQHKTNWLTTDKRCRYNEYRYHIFHVKNVNTNYLANLMDRESHAIAKIKRHEEALSEQKRRDKQRIEEEQKKWKVAEESFHLLANSGAKRVGDMVCSAQNVIGYIEAINGSRIKLNLRGKVRSGKWDYFLFYEADKERRFYVDDASADFIWAESSEWASCNVKISL